MTLNISDRKSVDTLLGTEGYYRPFACSGHDANRVGEVCVIEVPGSDIDCLEVAFWAKQLFLSEAA